MDHPEGEARRQRRTWLLRLFSQSLQRQQVGPAGPCVQRVEAPRPRQPGQGWAGQNCPQAVLAPDDFESTGGSPCQS